MSAVFRCTCPMSTPGSMGRALRSRGTTAGTVSTGLVLISVLGRPDELPAVLPRPAVTDLKRDIQERHALEHACHHERACIDRTEPDRLDELQDLVLGGLVVAGDEPVP